MFSSLEPQKPKVVQPRHRYLDIGISTSVSWHRSAFSTSVYRHRYLYIGISTSVSWHRCGTSEICNLGREPHMPLIIENGNLGCLAKTWRPSMKYWLSLSLSRASQQRWLTIANLPWPYLKKPWKFEQCFHRLLDIGIPTSYGTSTLFEHSVL